MDDPDDDRVLLYDVGPFIERMFRFIEMAAIIALIRVLGASHQGILDWATWLLACAASLYLTEPAANALVQRVGGAKRGRSRIIWVSGSLFVTVAFAMYIVAPLTVYLAHLISLAIR